MEHYDRIMKLSCELINSVVNRGDDVIELPSRGSDNYLMRIEGNQYQLISELRHERFIISDDETKIEAVDPPDGPFMPLGYKISGKVLVKIEYDTEKDIIILTLQDE